jgi:hypothetical protein
VGAGVLTRTLAVALLAFGASSCSAHLFSGVRGIDHARPVAWIETVGGAEAGVATEEGILFLGRTAEEGPCRVHYFLGDQAVVEDGAVVPFGGVFRRADIDLRHPIAHWLGRDPTPNDALTALLHDGTNVTTVPVQLATDPRLEGDVLAWPGRSLPAGTPVCVADGERWLVAGVVSGEVTLGDSDRFVVFAGCDRVREALATPRIHPPVRRVHYRPDDIQVLR